MCLQYMKQKLQNLSYWGWDNFTKYALCIFS